MFSGRGYYQRMFGKTQIVYVPGMKPKPPVADHEANLWRCMLHAVRRNDPALAAELETQRDTFRVAAWGKLFYDEHTSIEPDLAGIDRLLSLDGPEDRDIEEARHWHKRIGRLIYLLSDTFPFLIDWVANPNLKATLQDTHRYFQNHDGVATRIRQFVADQLLASWSPDARLLVIGHSLGSVIAYDVLWEMTRRGDLELKVDLLLTIGSPLGLNFMRHRMLNAKAKGAEAYPANVRRWANLSAVGEMTALDRTFADDYREMLDLGLVDSISDETDLLTFFRGPDGLNVHKCYGYMANDRTGAAISHWLRGNSSADSVAPRVSRVAAE